jgi:hypothetical protein
MVKTKTKTKTRKTKTKTKTKTRKSIGGAFGFTRRTKPPPGSGVTNQTRHQPQTGQHAQNPIFSMEESPTGQDIQNQNQWEFMEESPRGIFGDLGRRPQVAQAAAVEGPPGGFGVGSRRPQVAQAAAVAGPPGGFGQPLAQPQNPFGFGQAAIQPVPIRTAVPFSFGTPAAAIVAGPQPRAAYPDNYVPPDGQIPTYNRNFVPAGAEPLGQGSTKFVWGLPTDPGWAYMNSTTAKMQEREFTKQDMINDFQFARRLHGIDPAFFPGVVPQWNTARKFIYKKERCERIRNATIDVATLQQIIDRAVALMDTHLLFTLDLKPENVGILRGNVVFLDFGQENSFKLVEAARHRPDIRHHYVSFSILILLLHCYNYSPQIPKHALRVLAQQYIRIPHLPDFRGFYPGGRYDVRRDRNIDGTFNAPLNLQYTVEPHNFITAYGRDNWRAIIRELLTPVNNEL